MHEPPPALPSDILDAHLLAGTMRTPDAEDEAVAYVAPARMHLPRQNMLLALLSLLLLIVVSGGATAAYLLLGEPNDRPLLSAEQSLAAEKEAEIRRLLPPPPPVEAVHYLDVPREAAFRLNESIPFSNLPNPAAAPLRLNLAPADQGRAIDCLAAAAWYEAGDDALGQESVVQTVLNRARHPSFPNSVCGVVFQGAERATGCQFTFTCDGAMIRRIPSAAAWARAQAVARMAVNGFVFAPIGWATHYHTDWVVPNWSSSVDKVAKIRTHLFFRWRSGSGRPAAFHSTLAGTEPIIAAMGKLSPSHSGTLPLEPLPTDDLADLAGGPGVGSRTAPPPTLDVNLRGNALAAANNDSGLYVIHIKPDTFSGSLALLALDICKGRRAACTVVGFAGQPGRVTGGELGRVRWHDKAPDFYYFSDSSRSREIAYWNCTTFPRPDSNQCLPPNYQPTG